MSNQKVIILLGTTASGKTRLGVKIANFFNGEIISADSRQVYRGMDIGTGKDLEEYEIKIKNKKPKTCHREASGIKDTNQKYKNIKIFYHLIDVASLKTQFTLARWLKLTHKAISNMSKRGKIPIIVGGTPLYLNALIKGYQLPPAKLDKKLRAKLNNLTLNKLLTKLKKLDLKTYQKIDKKNRRRVQRALEIILQTKKTLSQQKKTEKPPYDFLILGITYPKKILQQKINKRVDKMFKNGLINETKKIIKKNGKKNAILETIGYQEIIDYLDNKQNLNKTIELIKTHTHQFTKHQMTWFSAKGGSASSGKKMKNIQWVKNYKQIKRMVKKFLN